MEASDNDNQPRVSTIRGNLLDAEDDIIAHQTNCVTKGAAGLAQHLFQRFPHANTYRVRTKPSKPGTTDIMGEHGKDTVIANLNAQYRPGRPAYEGSDTESARIRFFGECLRHLAEHIRRNMQGKATVGFPWRIGCGLAGGDWERYHRLGK